MIKFEQTYISNFEGALRGMRNPLNSWHLSDSALGTDPAYYGLSVPYIGVADLGLCQRLIKAGSDHAKFLRQMFVCVDITAPLYWWKEYDTYKVATVSNSCSTMHTIHRKEFTRSDFSIDKLVDYKSIDFTILELNRFRDVFLETKDKNYWYSMIQILPDSYNQKRTVTLNYATLRNMYASRKGHKLDEWSIGFMAWIDTLPYADELIKYNN